MGDTGKNPDKKRGTEGSVNYWTVHDGKLMKAYMIIL